MTMNKLAAIILMFAIIIGIGILAADDAVKKRDFIDMCIVMNFERNDDSTYGLRGYCRALWRQNR